MTTDSRWSDTATVRLCPVIIRGREDHWVVINRAGRRAISTSAAGVEAIRLLRRGRTVEHTRQVLAARYRKPVAEVDLAPLLDMLLSSGFVRDLDGRSHSNSVEPAGWWPGWGWLPEFALKRLPVSVALRVAYWWFSTAPTPGERERVTANLGRVPIFAQDPRRIARIVAGHAVAQRKQFCDRLALVSLPPRRVRAMLGRVRISGVEHLECARQRGTGAILCSLHLGSYSLIPFVLGAKGIPVTVYAGFGGDTRSDVAAWLAERVRERDSYPVRMVGGAMGVRSLVRSLGAGETVLLYCDRAPGNDATPGEPRGFARVPFLGTQVWSARGAGWLHRRTGAPVLSLALLWQGGAGHHLLIDPPVVAAGAGRTAVMESVFRALEHHVRQHPDQWLKWRDFDQLVAALPRSGWTVQFPAPWKAPVLPVPDDSRQLSRGPRREQ